MFLTKLKFYSFSQLNSAAIAFLLYFFWILNILASYVPWMHIAARCCIPNASTHEKNFRNFTIKLCRKNNLAAKKSRDARRVRENQLRLRVLCLENANRVLREQMDRKDVELVQLRWVRNHSNSPWSPLHSFSWR